MKKTIIAASVFLFLFANFVGATETGVLSSEVKLEAKSNSASEDIRENETENGIVGELFVLDGSKSQDDGVIKSFVWKQVSGPVTTLLNKDSLKPSFTPNTAGTYVFELQVTDSTGLSSIAQKVQVQVKGNDLSGDATERVLPTVNKADGDEGNSERLLPTVNKKTGAKVTVRGWDTEKKEEVESTINAKVEEDENIRMVEISEENVVVVYATPAKLFGFVNITMNLTIETSADGKVKVRLPWYSFLVSSEFKKAKEKFDYIFQNNETNIDFINAKGSAETQIEIFIQISKTMHEMSKSIIQNIKA